MFGKEDFVVRVMRNLLQGGYFGAGQADHLKGFQVDFINQLAGKTVNYVAAADYIDDLFKSNQFRLADADHVKGYCVDYINQLPPA